MSHTGSHAARRQADHNGRDRWITNLSCDLMCKAIHTPVGLPPTIQGGDGYALQEVNLAKCTSESPHSDALILRVAHRGGGTEIFPPGDDSVDTILTVDCPLAASRQARSRHTAFLK